MKSLRSMVSAGMALLCLGAILMSSCNTPHGDMATLLRDIDSYHRDLLFERYEIAAKRITPSERMSWLSAMKSQELHFAEIELLGTQPCSEYTEQCYIVDSQMQWYSGSSPSVNSSHVTSTWQFDTKTKSWQIVELSQN